MPEQHPRQDSAERVAQAIGASAPSPTGRCHWCGLPLQSRRENISRMGGEIWRTVWYCEECD